jgi:hypothetical protein
VLELPLRLFGARFPARQLEIIEIQALMTEGFAAAIGAW